MFSVSNHNVSSNDLPRVPAARLVGHDGPIQAVRFVTGTSFSRKKVAGWAGDFRVVFPFCSMCHVCLDDEAILALGPNDIFMSLTTV